MSIKNPTLAHFRHFSSLFTKSPPLHLSRTLYKSALFMQNKPNFQKSQMNVNIYLQTAYENKRDWTLGQNKPKTNPIAERVKLMQSVYLQRIMKKNAAKGYEKTKPKQTQFTKSANERKLLCNKGLQKKDNFAVRKNKPNSNPISSKAKMSENSLLANDYENKTALRPQKNKPKQSQGIKRARSIFQRFLLASLTQAPHINTTTPIFNPKTRISPLKSEKNPENPQFCVIFVLNFIDFNRRRISAVLKVEYPLHISPPKQKLNMLPSLIDVKELHREMTFCRPKRTDKKLPCRTLSLSRPVTARRATAGSSAFGSADCQDLLFFAFLGFFGSLGFFSFLAFGAFGAFGAFLALGFLGFLAALTVPLPPPSIKAATVTKTATTATPPIIYQIRPCMPARIEGVTPFRPATATTVV